MFSHLKWTCKVCSTCWHIQCLMEEEHERLECGGTIISHSAGTNAGRLLEAGLIVITKDNDGLASIMNEVTTAPKVVVSA